MRLKNDFIKRLNTSITIFLILFLVFISVYFFMSVNTKINSIDVFLNSLKSVIQDTDNLNIIIQELSGVYFFFISQLVVFAFSLIFLLIAFWYTTQKYLIMKKDSLIDPLTKIYNRRAVFFALNRELKRTQRYRHPTSIAMIDIDFFKKYNDTNGHVAGDRLLKRFAKIFRDTLREYDIYGRYGGEEFIVVFPETKLKNAVLVCERLRKLIEKTKFYHQERLPHKNVTVSIGVAEVKGKKRMKKETLIENADECLYKAKESGRNKVVYE